jgi:NTE family protein
MLSDDRSHSLFNETSAAMIAAFGVPGFFTPRFPPAQFWPNANPQTLSYYDTTPLRRTLERLVDFDRINDKATRLSVGAVNIATGNFTYFDNMMQEIRPEHIMASGALPPGFPAIEIDNEFYWDGGVASNTPLDYVLDQETRTDLLIFQVDLFSARGPLPRTIQDVEARQKDIMYSSRTRQITDSFQRLQRWKKRAYNALIKVPDADLNDEERAMRDKLANLPGHSIVQLIYQQQTYEGAAKDYEFSGTSMRDHRLSGHEDTKNSLSHKRWLTIPESGLATHDVHRDRDY